MIMARLHDDPEPRRDRLPPGQHQPPPARKLPLIGRDRVLIEKLARQVFKGLPHGTWASEMWDTLDRRGYAFEVQIRDEDGKPTGRIARVQITLDRVEA
jgi:hypothetical protein